jgi:hypothetical protein
MAIDRPHAPDMLVPLEFLTDPTLCSRNILGEYQLLHMKRAAELEKEMRELVRLYVAEMSAAGFALFMRENREDLLRLCSSVGTEALKE